MKTRTSETVAEEVRAMMARRRLYGIDLVEPLGISQTQVAKRVRGDLAWSLDELDALAGVFGCEVADLLPGRATTGGYVHAGWGLAA